MVADSYTANSQEEKAERPEVQGHPPIYNKFEANLRYKIQIKGNIAIKKKSP